MGDHSRKAFKIAGIALIFAIIGWVLPVISFTGTTYINASHITSTGLLNTSGDNVSLISSFDNVSWSGEEQSGVPWIVYITFENVTSFDFNELMMQYFSVSATPSTHIVNYEIFCVMENKWTDLRDFSNTPDFNYFSKRFIDYSHFIFSNGTVNIRLNHAPNGNNNHRVQIDVSRFAIQPQYEQINSTSTTTFTNTTVINTSCSDCVNQTQLNQKVNITTNSITNIIATDGTNFTQITLQPQVMSIEASDGGTSQIQITQDVINFAFNMTNSLLMNEGSTTSYKNLDMSNKNIINCANCVSVSSDLINETNISSATNWVNISIPSQYQNRFGYDIQIYINDTTGSTIIYKMYVNNLLNDSNYRSQFTQFNGASVVASRDSAANIATASTSSETFAKIYMGLSPGNNLVIQSETSRLIGSTGIIREQYYNTYITPITTIANISLFSPTASGIGAGSKISIFKSKLT